VIGGLDAETKYAARDHWAGRGGPSSTRSSIVHQASCLVGLRWLAAMRSDSLVGGEAALPSCQLGCGDGKCERDGKMQLEQLCGLHKFSQIFSQICVNEMRV